MSDNDPNWWTACHLEYTAPQALDDVTERYWDGYMTTDKNLDAPEDSKIAWYIRKLLPCELSLADDKKRIKAQACDTLALLVGYSKEPLLQAISVYQPRRLILLVNKSYEEGQTVIRGRDYGATFKRQIEYYLLGLLPASSPLKRVEVQVEVVGDRPESVFLKLCETLLPDQRAQKQVIVDITGAKKSMSGGAFMFGAYANVPISYVDFEKYRPDKRQPYGYSCRIDVLDSPYDKFALRDWEQVQHLYDSGHYRAAAERLAGIVTAMAGFVDSSDAQAADKWKTNIAAANGLLQVITFYARWNDGNYRAAFDMTDDLRKNSQDFPIPESVLNLGPIWSEYPNEEAPPPSVKAVADELYNRHRNLHYRICTNSHLLLAYAQDELDRIERLIKTNEDNRSALLRAAGLDEFLLLARLVRLWKANLIKVKAPDEGVNDPVNPQELIKLNQPLQEGLRKAMLLFHGTDTLRSMLQGGKPLWLDYYWNATENRYSETNKWWTKATAVVTYTPDPSQPRLKDYWTKDSHGLDAGTLKNLRNQAIHATLSLPRSITCAALRLAEANLNEFKSNGWVSLIPSDPLPSASQPLTWDQVVKLCGVTFLPLVSVPGRPNDPLDPSCRG
ncbi:MAG: hypothetical protein KIT87_27855 [Anaerolineae bacterium]|nr:hypothetical protein [Anaerolineae bacterium]